MKYIDEFRNGKTAKQVANAIQTIAHRQPDYYFMEFCGGHTHAIHRYGIQDLLPENIHMVHGPGCPVCVLPMNRLDNAIQLALIPDVILCTYGDMMRVPGSHNTSLLRAKSQGAQVQMVYSVADALAIAKKNPNKQIVFFAIGFETTTPPTAVAIKQAETQGIDNFYVFCNHVLTPAAIQNILNSPDIRQLGKVRIDGFIGPAHVSTVIGSQPYEYFAEEFQKPVVIAGFEPLDVITAIYLLIKQRNERRAEVENEFTRAVTRQGNEKAKQLVAEVFELRKAFEWRGLGWIPYSALQIKKPFVKFDAEKVFNLQAQPWSDNKSCRCGSVLRGLHQPQQCQLFGTVCTPETPVGPCMVSSEGACAAHYTYGRFRQHTG